MNAALCVILCLAATVLAGDAQEDYPPGTFQLTPQIDLHLQPTPLIVPNKYLNDYRFEGHNITLNLPPGFRVRLFAASRYLRKTRFMAFDPKGVLHVASMKRYNLVETNSEIIAFPDRDKDGIADAAIVAASGLGMAHSLAFYQDAMYVAEARQITRLRDEDGDGVYEEREVLVADIPALGHHTTRTIVIDEINEKIFVGVGAPCDLCRSEKPFSGGSLDPLPPTPEWGTILQFNIDGSGRRIYARGMRNTVGLTLHPVTNQLWGTHNGHDREGAHLPPEWIDIIREDGFMGYPFVYGYQVPVNFNIGLYQDVGILPLTREDSLLIQSQQRPVGLVPAHLAPMGIHFYTGDLFPAKYRHAAFVALRGGQTRGNLALVPGFKVIALFSEPDGSGAQLADFLTGFGTDPKGSSVWGKPVGITSDRFGNLYVSSDQVTNAVFRIEPGPLVGSFEHNLPDTIANGSRLPFEATVRLSRFAAEGESPTLTADLSPYGGSAAEPFAELEEGLFRLETFLEIEGPIGLRPLIVRAEQRAGGETHTLEFLRQFVVLPSVDIEILNGALVAGWRVETAGGARAPDLPDAADKAFEVAPKSYGVDWTVDFVPSTPVDVLGYTSLHFAFRADEVRIPRVPHFLININGLNVDLVRGAEQFRLDFEKPEWQIVEIPFDEFAVETGSGYPNRPHRLDEVTLLEAIHFIGNLEGTFYLDDMRLVAGASATVLPTLVQETHESPLPEHFSLQQNYPNPFNSGTVIHYALAQRGEVELAVYNMAGQQLAVLVAGIHQAGAYAIQWDGRDDRGRALASGVYLYRLRAEEGRVEMRKLVLVK